MSEQPVQGVLIEPEGLSDDQVRTLMRPLRKSRVAVLDGQSHLEAWDVRAHLIRLFGFGGWSADLIDLVLLYDLETTTKAGKPARKVAYRATVRLTIHATGATYTEAAVGENVMPDFKRGDGHDFAIKTAESQAFKRCAINLGTQFGLSLYNSGQTDDVVRMLVTHPHLDGSGEAPHTPDVKPTPEVDPDSLDPARVTDGNPYE